MYEHFAELRTTPLQGHVDIYGTDAGFISVIILPVQGDEVIENVQLVGGLDDVCPGQLWAFYRSGERGCLRLFQQKESERHIFIERDCGLSSKQCVTALVRPGYHPGGTIVFLAQEKQWEFWSLSSGIRLSTMWEPAIGAAFSPNGAMLAYGTSKGSTSVMRLDDTFYDPTLQEGKPLEFTSVLEGRTIGEAHSTQHWAFALSEQENQLFFVKTDGDKHLRGTIDLNSGYLYSYRHMVREQKQPEDWASAVEIFYPHEGRGMPVGFFAGKGRFGHMAFKIINTTPLELFDTDTYVRGVAAFGAQKAICWSDDDVWIVDDLSKPQPNLVMCVGKRRGKATDLKFHFAGKWISSRGRIELFAVASKIH